MTVDALAADSGAADAGTADPSIEERRQSLRNRFRRKEDPTALGRVIEALGWAVQRLLRRPEPLSYGSSSALLTGAMVAMFAAETYLRGWTWAEHSGLISVRLALMGLYVLMLVTCRIAALSYVSLMDQKMLDHVESRSDLTVLERGLNQFTGYRLVPTVIFALLYGVLLEWLNVEFAYSEPYPSAAFSITGVFVQSGFGLGLIGILQGWVFFIVVGRLRLKLYAPDPSRSEVIVHLSRLLRTDLSLLAAFGVLLTLAYTFLKLTDWFTIVSISLLMWIPIIGFFAVGQWSLSKLISTAKWRELREVQARVERLKTEGNLEEEETMGAVRRLMEYYDRVARAPGSVFNLRAGLNFVNSLLLPVVALVLANWEKVRGLFD